MDTGVEYVAVAVLGLALSVGGFACGGDRGGTGSTCGSADDCYQGVEIEGDAVCFTQVEGGYCSHTCESKEDCCAADGECPEGFDYLCTGLESRSGKFCFVDCNSDAQGGGGNETCNEFGDGLECRNTGRGAGSKACLPPSG